MHTLPFKKTAIALTLALCTVSTHASEQDLQKQIDELTSKIAELEQKTTSNTDSISSLIGSNIKDAITFNGFASFGFSQFDDGGYSEEYYNGQGSKLSTKPNTWLGLQMNARLYEGGNVVAQVVSKGSSDDAFELDMEWLFFKQDMGAGFSAQLGRIRFPALIDSEVVYIGNTYPTVAPPAEIYSVLPINHIDGASISQTSDIGDWVLETKAVLWGNSEEEFDGYTLRLHRIHGLSVSANYNYLSMRIAGFRAEERIEINDPVYAADFGDKLNYITGAVRYDDEQFYASAEGIIITSKNDLIDENRNWNITTGVYAGPVLMYIGHSRTRVTNSDDMSEALTEELGYLDVSAQYSLPPGSILVPKGVIYSPFMTRHQNSNTTGIKYNINGSTVLKAQVQYVYALDDSQGNFNTATATVPFEHMYIYDVAIQATF